MSPKDRLRIYIEFKGLTVAAFERECGLGNGFVSKIGDSIRKDKLELISNSFPDLNIDWIINEKGSMLETDNCNNNLLRESESNIVSDFNETYNRNNDNSQSDDYVLLLPVEAMAGSLQGLSEGVELRNCRKIKCPVRGADWAIQISGDSMEPEYRNGSYIYIKKMSGSFIPWGNTMVIDTIDGVVVKNIYPIEGTKEYIEARSLNPKYPPFQIETSCIIGMYRVLGGSFINSTI